MSLVIPGYRVLIKPEPIEKETESGIVIVRENEKLEEAKREYGVVAFIGEGCWRDNNGRWIGNAGPWCQVGDKVIYSKYGGKFVTDPDDPDQKYVVVNDQDILAVVVQEK